MVRIFHNITIFLNQMNAAFVKIRDFKPQKKFIFRPQTNMRASSYIQYNNDYSIYIQYIFMKIKTDFITFTLF